jgi:hypothetical protein
MKTAAELISILPVPLAYPDHQPLLKGNIRRARADVRYRTDYFFIPGLFFLPACNIQ